jgi:hypothetical protein
VESDFDLTADERDFVSDLVEQLVAVIERHCPGLVVQIVQLEGSATAEHVSAHD